MTDNEKLRYEYFIETGIVWIDTNDSIELDYLKWLEAKIIYTRCCEELKDKEVITPNKRQKALKNTPFESLG